MTKNQKKVKAENQEEIKTEKPKKVRAEVTPVPIGPLEIEGLLTEKGEFGVAVPQIAKLFPYFQDFQNQASKYLKRLMGNDFKTTKITTRFNRNTTLMVDLDGFVQVIKALAKKQDSVAIDLMDILVGLSLKQLFCDAFGIKFDEEDRQQHLTERMLVRKSFRLFLTDSLKEFGYTEPEQYAMFVKKMQDKLGIESGTRDQLPVAKLVILDNLQKFIGMMVKEFGMDPYEALEKYKY